LIEEQLDLSFEGTADRGRWRHRRKEGGGRTVVASRRLTERGVRGKRQRAVVDQAAAVEILQSWLDAQRRQS
jgi:hypothetical protein